VGRTQASLTLASTSPQRRAILEQLRIGFRVVAPAYEERDPPAADPVELVRAHARAKAASVAGHGWTLGVDTTVHLDGRIYAKPRDAGDASRILRALSGRAHSVVSGLCLLHSSGAELVADASTRVRFASLGPRALDLYLASGEWSGRAGGYAIQGLAGRYVESVEGDYLNVVGLPGALLVGLLETHAPELLEIPR
jgi:septum formation protein